MDFHCQDALPLVPSYLDGELSEVRAGFLRKHLLDCQACRASAQDGKLLARWFAQPAKLQFAPPSGFAARVARRAFAGDTGSQQPAETATRERGRLLQFVLGLSAAAAALMMLSAIALRDQALPGADSLNAASEAQSVEAVLQRLEELNRQTTAPNAAPSPEMPASKSASQN
jgi:hypothetical protein